MKWCVLFFFLYLFFKRRCWAHNLCRFCRPDFFPNQSGFLYYTHTQRVSATCCSELAGSDTHTYEENIMSFFFFFVQVVSARLTFSLARSFIRMILQVLLIGSRTFHRMSVTSEQQFHICLTERGMLIFDIGKHTFQVFPYPAVPDTIFHHYNVKVGV